MTRRDMIVVAVLANIGILAILFMLAFHSDEDKAKNSTEIAYTLTEEPAAPSKPSEAVVKIDPIDEIDAALEEETPTAAGADEENFQLVEPDTPVAEAKKEEVPPVSQGNFVEVTVKRGDALEKIARANGTTVESIMKANNMKSDRLRIGQVLKVPVGTKKTAVGKTSPPKPIADNEAKAPPGANVEYYTIKNGDNPWKIAKQFHIRLDELLKLNNLDEEKARNLKVGDTIRVK